MKNKWLDHYAKKAKIEGYPSRAIYKLKEIQQKYHILEKGFKVLDLGCSPGSWLIYSAKKVGKNGTVIGIDLKKIKINLPKNVFFFNSCIYDENSDFHKQKNMYFNSIISDMAPNTTGNKIVDNARSLKLSQKAIEISTKKLFKGGNFICKIFYNEEIKTLLKILKINFKKHFMFKPKSSKKASREIYLIGLSKI